MVQSPFLKFESLSSGQSNAEVIVNDALRRLEIFGNRVRVKDNDLALSPDSSISSGDRSASITVTKSGGVTESGTSSVSNLVDGATGNTDADSLKFNTAFTVTDEWIRWTYTSGTQTITELRVAQQDSSSHGTWKVQASPDDTNWFDISDDFTLGGATSQTITITTPGDYAFYRILGVSGTADTTPYIHEFTWVYDSGTTPTDGDAYILPASPDGRWANFSQHDIVFYFSGWIAITPKEGMEAWIDDEDRNSTFDGTTWQLPASEADLTDNTFGNPSDTLAQCTGGFATVSDTNVDDNFASIASKINDILNILEKHGLN